MTLEDISRIEAQATYKPSELAVLVGVARVTVLAWVRRGLNRDGRRVRLLAHRPAGRLLIEGRDAIAFLGGPKRAA